MKILKLILFGIFAILGLVAVLYRFILPFTSPKEDLIIWCVIGIAVLALFLMARDKK